MLAVNTLGTGIRFRPVGFTGDMVMHCHIFQHEDYGSMQLFRVTDDPDVCEAIRRQNGWSREMLFGGSDFKAATFDVQTSTSSFSLSPILLVLLVVSVLVLVTGGIIFVHRYRHKQTEHIRLEEVKVSEYDTTRSRPDELELR